MVVGPRIFCPQPGMHLIMLDARSGRDPTYSTSGDYQSEVMMVIKTKITRLSYILDLW